MRLDFKLNFFDVCLFHFVHYFFSIPMQIMQLGGAALITSTVKDYASWQELMFTGVISYVMFWLASWVFLLLYLLLSGLKNLLGARSLELRDTGLFEECDYGQSLLYWSGVRKIVERPGFAAIYISSMQAHLIPSRAFASKAERTAFLDAVRSNVKQARLAQRASGV